MIIKGKEYNIEDIVENLNIDSNIPMKRENGLVLRNSQIEILKRYHIDYKKFNTLNSLISEIEDILIEEDEEELEILSIELQEQQYYNYTNK
ncbi:MAG: hypothetical protein HFE04_00545 [Bacilli bacterium]|nr:hypothetical protein [Bacilli bacterium]